MQFKRLGMYPLLSVVTGAKKPHFGHTCMVRGETERAFRPGVSYSLMRSCINVLNSLSERKLISIFPQIIKLFQHTGPLLLEDMFPCFNDIIRAAK